MMGRKKKELLSVTFCGTFFPTEFLEKLKEIILEEENDEIELTEFYRQFIGGFDYKEFPHFQNSHFLLINQNNVKNITVEDGVDGYFVGVDILDLPEHFSIKRMKIDVRNVLEQLGLLSDDEDSDVIQTTGMILEI